MDVVNITILWVVFCCGPACLGCVCRESVVVVKWVWLV